MEELIEIKKCQICGVELTNISYSWKKYQQNICTSCRSKMRYQRYREKHKNEIKDYNKKKYKKRKNKQLSLLTYKITSQNELKKYLNKYVYIEYVTKNQKIRIYKGVIFFIKKYTHIEIKNKCVKILTKSIIAVGEVKNEI